MSEPGSARVINWNALLKSHFRVRGSHEIYVLGCFARHVTLYSQQVRALNLIYGLCKTGKLTTGKQLAIIGGGAAGLTAAAAAAFRRAHVTLFDELEGPMELQQNNRQRWIHPYIYDWPYVDESLFEQFKEGEAGLPLLSWSAGYAANVARQISSQWELLQNAYHIDARWSARGIKLTRRHGRLVRVGWDKDQAKDFPLVILALGFGLEPKKDAQDSYWAEDDLDGGFRRPNRRPRWLVSGGGDGALTDLMRLCIHRFRQDEILNLFVTAQGIEGLKKDLRELHYRSADLSERDVSKRFANISIDSELRNLVKETLRSDGPKIVLMTQDDALYGPKTSVLNRLVVRILKESQPAAFEHLIGRTRPVRPKSEDFQVRLVTGKKPQIRRFDRVLLRHGPKSNFAKDFRTIYRGCARMQSLWKRLAVNQDVTRRPIWSARFFGPQLKFPASENEEFAKTPMRAGFKTQDANFAESVRRFGVVADSIGVFRQVRSDGSSHVTYTVEGLSVLKGELSGISFRYKSGAGKVDRVRIEAPRSLGLKWVDERDKSPAPPKTKKRNSEPDGFMSDQIAQQRDAVRRLSGTVRFRTPLKPSDAPLSFRLSFRLLNGDALSKWEFLQMYGPEQQKHMDGKRLKRPTEYLARMVWFPVRALTIRISLPTCIREALPSVFLYPRHWKISRTDVVKNRVLLYSHPDKWKMSPKAVAKPLLPPLDLGMFKKFSSHGWVLSVPKPLVGSCYSIEWPLPETREDSFTLKLENDANRFRRILLRYRDAGGDESQIRWRERKAVRYSFQKFYDSLLGQDDPGHDRFEVTFMTYDTDRRRLLVVDGVRNGRELNAKSRDFWLPFGLGMAGSCFKSGRRIFVMNLTKKENDREEERGWPLNERDTMESDPGFYLKIPHRSPHKFLLQIPVDYPRFVSSRFRDYESARQCIGVVSISSLKGTTWLSRLTAVDDLRRLQSWCQGFCNDLYRILVLRHLD